MTGENRFCKNCKRDVSAGNFSLHEAHCMRFLTLCPECDELVAQKDMEDHQAEAHKQIRCSLCHQSMQQYQLEHHENKECQKRAMKCNICDLEMPFNKLQEHLDICGSRTERCQECNKYIMYKDHNKHKDICLNSGLSYHKDVDFQTGEASTNATFTHPTGIGGNLCRKCNKSFPDDQYSQHLVSIFKTEQEHYLDPQQSSSSLAPSSSSENAMAWKDVRPKGKERDQSLTSKMPKNKKISSPSPTSPQALKDTQSFDMLVTCDYCNILLPLPTLRKHEIKCLHWTTLQNARMKQE
ncbi:XAF1 factor, partial [Ptilonorhynchus violaceus]|nr:XAF1 factor [Ptilonorhynchus violaceus]